MSIILPRKSAKTGDAKNKRLSERVNFLNKNPKQNVSLVIVS